MRREIATLYQALGEGRLAEILRIYPPKQQQALGYILQILSSMPNYTGEDFKIPDELPFDSTPLVELIRLVVYVPPPNVFHFPGLGLGRETTTPLTAGEQRLDKLRQLEIAAWRGVLGREIHVPSPPSFLTPEVLEKLEGMGLKVCYIPKLNIGTPEVLRNKGPKNFLDWLQERYPNWSSYKSLRRRQRKDHSVSRNLGEWYWREVAVGNTEFPTLPGKYVAVGREGKPARGKTYEISPTVEMLEPTYFGSSAYRDYSWEWVQAAIQKGEQEILTAAGLPTNLNLKVRLPTAVEWNLLANRKELRWGATNTWELTDTVDVCHWNGFSYCIIVGNSEKGGAASADRYPLNYMSRYVGFRLIIDLGR